MESFGIAERKFLGEGGGGKLMRDVWNCGIERDCNVMICRFGWRFKEGMDGWWKGKRKGGIDNG